MVFAIKVTAAILAVVTIPEVAVMQEDAARIHSRVLYNNSIMGYRVGVEISKETILTTLDCLRFRWLLLYYT